MIEHYSVMKDEVISMLDIKPDGIYVDGTLGRGGHTTEILKKIKNGHVYAFDLDVQAINKCESSLVNYSDKITYIHDNFANFKVRLAELGVNKIDGLLLDLGVSSPQFDQPERGFSYRYDAPLDMRMNQEQEISAYDVVNTYEFNELNKIFGLYGEEKYCKQIARKIEQYRMNKPIETTFELVDVIKSALPSKVLNKKGHPCKKSFQAIRIEVNHELESLNRVLEGLNEVIEINGTVVIITFHSLEDRIVKDCFKEMCKSIDLNKDLKMLPNNFIESDFKPIAKKVLIASDKELLENSRSSSAKLRGIRRVK